MTDEESLALMEHPERWPLKIALALAHAKRTDETGFPLVGFLAWGHGPKVYLANLGDFQPGESTTRAGFEKALERFESLSYVSLRAVLGDGWNVD
jgi:hypothetical protein